MPRSLRAFLLPTLRHLIARGPRPTGRPPFRVMRSIRRTLSSRATFTPRYFADMGIGMFQGDRL